MIEISHAQARRWVRQSLDRLLNEGQWSALQGHLENCADCRAYRSGREAVERNLRRDLNAGWTPTATPPGLPRKVIARLQRRSARRQGLLRAALVLGALLLVFGLVWSAAAPDAEAPASAALVVEVTPTAAPSPTPVYDGDFRGVLAFEAPAQDGQPIPASAGTGQPRPPQPLDIFLLAMNTGSAELTNLTDHPARDYAPAWSPDGNWIAFLSERERESGADIYMISVAGSGLTRLTDNPNLTWSGPLAWSPDGSWIAAIGVPVGREDARISQRIFHVPVDGVRLPRALPDTRGGSAPRFAPNRPILAYIIQEDGLTFIRAYDDETRQTRDLTRANAQISTAGGVVSLGVTTFEWTADGREIFYLARLIDPLTEPTSTLARMVEVADFEPVRSPPGSPDSAASSAAYSSRMMAAFPGNAPVISATLSPHGELLFTRSLRRFGQGPRCRPLLTPPLSSTSGSLSGQLALPGLCVQSGIERASWTSDGRRMVFGASTETGDEPGIYALSIPARSAATRVARTERLADLPAGAGTPRVRPTGSSSSWLEQYVLAGKVD